MHASVCTRRRREACTAPRRPAQGPVAGGTVVEIFGRFGEVDFLTLAPETAGLPDYGRPSCVFGQGLGRSGAAEPDVATASPALLRGVLPLRYALDTIVGDNSTVPANIGRRRMCTAEGADDRTYCSCARAVDPDSPVIPGCGCGCRRLLDRDATNDFDMCVDRRRSVDDPPDITCGPHTSARHRRHPAVPAVSARCVAPPSTASGIFQLEFAPNGEVRSTSRSGQQAVAYRYYDVSFTSLIPRASPLDGGTQYVIRGSNLYPFGQGTQTGAFNIYGVPSQARLHSCTCLSARTHAMLAVVPAADCMGWLAEGRHWAAADCMGWLAEGRHWAAADCMGWLAEGRHWALRSA